MQTMNSMWRSALLIAGMIVSGALWSAEPPFNEAAFDAAQRAGKPILVTVHADWCPTCRVQDEALQELLAGKKFAGMSVFRIDFDSQKAVLKRFGVRYQSTLIVFKGKNEVARSVAQTSKDAIASDLSKSL